MRCRDIGAGTSVAHQEFHREPEGAREMIKQDDLTKVIAAIKQAWLAGFKYGYRQDQVPSLDAMNGTAINDTIMMLDVFDVTTRAN
jgi:hypothetical protein